MRRRLAPRPFTRRLFAALGLALPATLLTALIARRVGSSPQLAPMALGQSTSPTATPTTAAPPTPVLVPTPACGDDDDDDATLAQTEGPFFSPDSPERSSLLEYDLPGDRVTVAGYVYATDCRPVAGALIDFWQADAAGEYDNRGFRLRGHQFTDDDGRYELATVMPGLYPGRTPHIHVKVQAPDRPVLTTQLYFPDEPDNDRDRIFDPALMVEFSPDPGPTKTTNADGTAARVAFFTFVLDLG